jgi:hypothetical protein
MDRRFIRWRLLNFALMQCTNYSSRCTDAVFQGIVSLSDGVSVFFLLGLDPQNIYYLLILACDIFASLGPRNVYKDMLNNMVSPTEHVVMNDQNQI